ncbi:MAG: hypothetical protein RQ899_08695 [Pseudomonadales bacterium]|nr:hypothetical protein [Pseudomonadales bacterium]
MTYNTKLSGNCRTFVSPGMPALDVDGKVFSFFEFWPAWLMYLPVALQWLALSLRHRSLTLPLVANPAIPLSGMIGVPKSQLLAQASGDCAETVLSWFVHRVEQDDVGLQADRIQHRMREKDLAFPVVCKPDIGCRGAGVKLVKNAAELAAYVRSYPVGSDFLVQKLSRWEAEAGIFYVREPGAHSGRIVSMALKYMPYVVGDGTRTLAELIAADGRASKIPELYLDRHKDTLHVVIPSGEPYRLIFSASHCSGAIFRDAEHLITPQLTQRIETLMRGIPEFYYGRLDIKFSDTQSLQEGCNLEIVEINAASSESLHIWDRKTTLLTAVKSLLWQYRTLFRLGLSNRARGFSPPGVMQVLRRWQHERALTRHYPDND